MEVAIRMAYLEAIPLESRIIRIIDSIVAMAHDLPYRKNCLEQLIKELKKEPVKNMTQILFL